MLYIFTAQTYISNRGLIPPGPIGLIRFYTERHNQLPLQWGIPAFLETYTGLRLIIGRALVFTPDSGRVGNASRSSGRLFGIPQTHTTSGELIPPSSDLGVRSDGASIQIYGLPFRR